MEGTVFRLERQTTLTQCWFSTRVAQGDRDLRAQNNSYSVDFCQEKEKQVGLLTAAPSKLEF